MPGPHWSRWLVQVSTGESPCTEMSIRLTTEARDQLAALCIRMGGISRQQVLMALLDNACSGTDVYGDISRFLATGEVPVRGDEVARAAWSTRPERVPAVPPPLPMRGIR